MGRSSAEQVETRASDAGSEFRRVLPLWRDTATRFHPLRSWSQQALPEQWRPGCARCFAAAPNCFLTSKALR